MVQKRGRSGQEGLTALHRVRFLEWRPTAAVASCATADGSAAAIARESGRLELWDAKTLTCISASQGHSDASLSSLTWAEQAGQNQPRLLSGALDGQLIEWDTDSWKPRASSDSFGGAVWCLAAQPRMPQTVDSGDAQEAPLIAVGADDGSTRLFQTQPDTPGLQYVRTMPRVEGRILSAAWHPSGQALVTGTSAGTLHVWDIASGQEIRRMVAGSRDTCVWALTVLPDGSMASGDSAGMLAFWDASFGTQLCSFKHQADILAVAASPAGDAVFASGIDSRVCMYKHMPVAGQQQGAWQFLEAKRPHTHDVRTLTVVGAADSALQLLSAGADARLQLSSVPRFQQEHSVCMDSCPEPPLLCCSPSSGKAHDGPSGRVAAMQHGRIDIWDLGTSAPPAQGMQEGCALELASQPVHVASFSSDSSHGRHHPHTASLSHDGSLLAWADSSSSSPCLASICHCDDSASLGACYRAAHAADPDQVEASPAAGSGGWSIQRHDCRLRGARSIARVAFAGNACLLTACHDGEVLVTNLLSSRVTCMSAEVAGTQHRGQLQAGHASAVQRLQPAVRALHCSADGRWAAVLGARHAHIFNLQQLTHHGHLSCSPVGQAASAAAFAPGQPLLAVASTSNDIQLYDVENCVPAVAPQHGQASWPQQPQAHAPGCITRIAFAPGPKGCRALLASAASLRHVDFEGPAPAAQQAKRSRRRRQSSLAWQPAGGNFRALPLPQTTCCLMCSFLSPQDVLLIEKSWMDVAASFPPPLYRHRYGT